MKLSQNTIKAIQNLQDSYPKSRSALIPALHLAQKEIGYLPRIIQEEIATLFNIDLTEVHSVVTFYDMFHEEPVGKHVIHVCKNISCMLRGSDEVLEGVCKYLKTTPGCMSADGKFTVIASECLGACDKAPMMLVDDQVVGPVNLNEIGKIIESAKEFAGHPSPMEEFRG